MNYISESESAAIGTHALAYSAVYKAFVCVLEPSSSNFPILKAHGSDPQNKFGVKASSDQKLAGLKVGSYFPTNDEVGRPRHGSIILLFDQSKGVIEHIIEGGTLNCYRTAAANAVATDALARKDATTLALFGTGHQAEYEAEAIAGIRDISSILVVGRSVEKTDRLVSKLQKKGLPAKACGAKEACLNASIIVTVTTANQPLFKAQWVQLGTHISSMGSDAIGKQELPPEIYTTAKLFCDLPQQSRSVGEFQHVPADMTVDPIGYVLNKTQPGRLNDDDITVFDSSGISLQDLYMAEMVVEKYLKKQEL